MTTLSPTALEASAKAAYHATPRNKPYDKLTLFKKNMYRTESTAAITAYLAQAGKEGWVMVHKPVWTPPFKVGDRVHHISRSEIGTVTSTDDGLVVVEFDGRLSGGGVSVGKFDERWFKTHNGWLLAAAQNGGE